MNFLNRHHAGKELATKMGSYTDYPDGLILGLPRGGVVTGYELAHVLHLPLDVISLRKIGAPGHKELAIGAVDENGVGYFNRSLIDYLGVSSDYIRKEVENEKQLAQKRLELYRRGKPELQIKNKTIFLVDDGLATGATMKAAIQAVKAKTPKKIIVAVPVGPPETLDEIRSTVDELICLYAPSFFSAVGEFYDSFEATSDEEVIELLKKADLERANKPAK